MKKIILILFIVITYNFADANYDEDSHCCTQFNQTFIDEIGDENVLVWNGTRYTSDGSKRISNPAFDTAKIPEIDSRICQSVGVVRDNQMLDHFDVGSDWETIYYTKNDGNDGQYDTRDWHVYYRTFNYNCECNLPDIEPTDPDPTWYPVEEVTDLVIISRIDCVETKQYYKVKEECAEDEEWSELSDGSFGCVKKPCVVVNEGDCQEPIYDGNGTCLSGITDDNGTCIDLRTCDNGYIELMDIDVNSSCENPINDATNELSYVDIYPLYSDIEQEFNLCCVKLKNSETPTDNNSSDSNTDDSSDSSSNSGGSSGGSSDSGSSSSSETTIGDSNSTDSNSTGLSLSGLESKLDKLNKDNNLNANRNHEDLDSLEKKLDTLNKDNKTDSASTRGVIASASNVAHQDSVNIKDVLVDIKGILESANSSDGNSTGGSSSDDNSSDNSSDSNSSDDNSTASSRKDVDKQNEAFAELALNSIKTYTDGFNNLKAMLGLIEAPVINYGGSCELSVAVYGQNASLSDTMKEVLPIFKPILLLVLNITLAFYLIKLSVLVFWDIFNKIYVVF